MSDPEVLLLVPYAFHVAAVTPLKKANRLTEYDVIVFHPAPSGVDAAPGERFERLKTEQMVFHGMMLGKRRKELEEFLEAGGVLAVLLYEIGGYVGQREEEFIRATELVLGDREFGQMGIREEAGKSIVIADPDDPMSTYLEKLSQWDATITRGGLADDPHSYALATSRDDRTVALVEHVGRGTVYWLPYPHTDGDWRRLLEVLAGVWADQSDPLLGLAAEELSDIEDNRDGLAQALRQALKDLDGQRKNILDRRRRLVAADRAVERSLQHYRSGLRSSPARALDFWHRMLEVIEYDYGGEQKARDALGYQKADDTAITRPANHKPYRSRHEGGQDEPVPAEVLAKAKDAASKILGLFLRRRLEELDRTISPPTTS